MAHFTQMLNTESMNYRIDTKSAFVPLAPDEAPDDVRPRLRPNRPSAPSAKAIKRPRPVSPDVAGDPSGQPVPDLLRVGLPGPSDKDVLASVMQQMGTTQPAEPAAEDRSETTVPSEPVTGKAISWKLPGFDRRCRVSTIFGELPIEALRLRDQVKTLSGAYKQVQWIDEIRLDADFLRRHPEAHPIQLRARSLGGTQPGKNILVSPGQMLHATGLIGNIKKGLAAEFDGYPSINRLQQTEITYYRFHCGEPETVSIEGAWFCVSP